LREINGKIEKYQRILILVQRYEKQYKQKKIKSRRENEAETLLKSRLRKAKNQIRIKLLKKEIGNFVDR
jgi:hypothetical protein